jgi:hypothetical protein
LKTVSKQARFEVRAVENAPPAKKVESFLLTTSKVELGWWPAEKAALSKSQGSMVLKTGRLGKKVSIGSSVSNMFFEKSAPVIRC